MSNTAGMTSADDPFGLLGGEEFAPASASAAGVSSMPAESKEVARRTSKRLGKMKPAPAKRAVAAAVRRDFESCSGCSGRLLVKDGDFVCEGCGLLVAGDGAVDEDEGAAPPASSSRLRIVGAGSRRLQPDLDRSSDPDSSASQLRAIIGEFEKLRDDLITRGGLAFPPEHCKKAAHMYHSVRTYFVRRAARKREVIAAVLRLSCLESGFNPSLADLAAFVQMEVGAIAKGMKDIYTMAAEVNLDFEVEVDVCAPAVATAFFRLGLDGAENKDLREAARAVVDTAEDRMIGIRSMARSKAIAAAYVVLRRAALASRPSIPLLTLAAVAKKCGTHENTLDKFIKDIRDYHRYFEPIYKTYGLATAGDADV